MPALLILGANGQLARNTTRVFPCDTDAQLSLHLRRRLSHPDRSHGLSDPIVKLALTPGMESRRSLGVSRTWAGRCSTAGRLGGGGSR
jgi:hypothetical protein